jgi:hypothetical protein
VGRQEWWVRLLTSGLDWLSVALTLIAYVGCAWLALYASLHPRDWGRRETIWFVLLLVAGVGGTIIGAFKQGELRRLREQNGRLVSKLGTRDYFKTFDDALSTFSDMLGCGDTERLTVYLKSGNNFVVLGRFARRPQLGERSRPMYP